MFVIAKVSVENETEAIFPSPPFTHLESAREWVVLHASSVAPDVLEVRPVGGSSANLEAARQAFERS